eukprot:9972658-Heterocapsa_arctica.AAC.1
MMGEAGAVAVPQLQHADAFPQWQPCVVFQVHDAPEDDRGAVAVLAGSRAASGGKAPLIW